MPTEVDAKFVLMWKKAINKLYLIVVLWLTEIIQKFILE